MAKEPTEVRVDKFAPMQIAREYRLSPIEAYTLYVLVLLADWRSESWIGTVTELAAEVRTTRTTQVAAVRRLEEHGLITVAEPFTSNRPGLVVIDIYGRYTKRAKTPPRSRQDHAATSLRAETDAVTPSDQQVRVGSKEEGADKEEGGHASHSLRERPALGAYRRQA